MIPAAPRGPRLRYEAQLVRVSVKGGDGLFTQLDDVGQRLSLGLTCFRMEEERVQLLESRLPAGPQPPKSQTFPECK